MDRETCLIGQGVWELVGWAQGVWEPSGAEVNLIFWGQQRDFFPFQPSGAKPVSLALALEVVWEWDWEPVWAWETAVNWGVWESRDWGAAWETLDWAVVSPW